MVSLPESSNPNFPKNLSIGPSTHRLGSGSEIFGELAQKEAITKYGIAGRVWEAAYAMNLYIYGSDNWEFDPPFLSPFPPQKPLTMLELGSGTGIVGYSIANKLAGSIERDLIIVTDLPEVCALLEENLQLANPASVGPSQSAIIVKPLTWGNSEHAFHISESLGITGHPTSPRFLTHIICSDLVYFPELLAPLLRTLIHISSPPFVPCPGDSSLKIIISYKIRSLPKETPFWAAFGLWFAFEPVLARPLSNEDSLNESQSHKSAAWQRFGASPSDDDSNTTFVFVASRRVESFSWHVPDNDRDLLDGVGARGSMTTKVDDTFESLLLMNLSSNETEDI